MERSADSSTAAATSATGRVLSAKDLAAALAQADLSVARVLELASRTVSELSSCNPAGLKAATASALEYVAVVESIHEIVAEAIVHQAVEEARHRE